MNSLSDRLILYGIFSGLFASAAIPLLDPSLGSGLVYEALQTSNAEDALIVKPGFLLFIAGMVLLGMRTVLWARYRPHPSVRFDYAPFLTVVIPAYNEGGMVKKSILSCVAANYPRDRLEIIAVDDGSKDETWRYIDEMASAHPDLIRAIRFPRNRGKRAALAAGFESAKGDVVVTLDSDSAIEREGLLAIAGPFRDAKIGAVAGKVSVLNRFESLLPRMLHVRYMLSFDFLRSAQSSYGAVYCCPGAFSAYRLNVVRGFLPRWLNQTFLGAACTTGEDRALTNEILARGYKTVYQQTAVVHTLAPTTYAKLCKMFLRWDRSYIREDIRLLTSINWKLPLPALLMTAADKTVTNLRYIVAYPTLIWLMIHAVHHPLAALHALLWIGLASFFYMLYFLKTERSWEFIYGVIYSYFSLFFLAWILPFALVTLRSRSWMTR